ncbi:MAG: cytochrome C' [Burkholderiales bacterium]|nr:cytochrome C' [Burkholderiales bacterium]
MKAMIAAATAAVAMMASGVAMADPAGDAVALVKSSGGDCLVCHAIDHKVVGPAWNDVSARYNGDIKAGKTTEAKAEDALVEKVTKGGKGNWDKVTGGMSMTPHPSKPSNADLHKIVKLILDLKK